MNFSTSTNEPRSQVTHPQPELASTINLADAGLCALRYTDDQAARAFYDRHRPTVFVMDDRESDDPISYYIYQAPHINQTLSGGISLYIGDVPIDPDKVEIEGDLADAPELPAEFLRFSGQALADLREYVEGGWHLVLIPGGRKGPTGKGWNRPESSDNPNGFTQNLDRINRHLESGGNVGLATQPSRVAVLDIDDLQKATEFFVAQNLGAEFDALLAEKSQLHILSGRPGRDKILFHVPDDFNQHTLNKSFEFGLEFRFQSAGGTTTQDVLPPSIHPDTGAPYRWGGSIERIQPLPEWLTKLWVKLESPDKQPKARGHNSKDYSGLETKMLIHALESVPSDDYDTWVKVGLALKNDLKDQGYEIWVNWSRTTSQGNFSEENCSDKWHNGLNSEVARPVGIGTIYYLADTHGWSKKHFSESQHDLICQVIAEKNLEVILSDDFLDLLELCKLHAPTLWLRKIDPALASAKVKKRVTDLLQAKIQERRSQVGHSSNEREDDTDHVDIVDPGECFPSIKLLRTRTHEVLDVTLRVLADTTLFYTQGPAICKLARREDGASLVTFAQPAELRPELLRHAHWLKRTEQSGWVRTEPSSGFAGELMACIDKSAMPKIVAIAKQPFYREDFSLCRTQGYDAQTGIYGDFDPQLFSIPASPTKDDATAAAVQLQGLFQESGLDSQYDVSAALSAVITAAIRPILPVAPFILLNAKSPGTGKKYANDMICQFASRNTSAPLVLKRDETEAGKEVLSHLMKGDQTLIYDEIEVPEDGTFRLPKPLLTVATDSAFGGRILGKLAWVVASTRTLVTLMGNGIRPTQDTIRRLIIINFADHDALDDVKVYSRNPLSEIKANREHYVGLALTIIQAWVTAGCPRSGVTDIPTYSVWCSFVREPMLWLGLPDPAHNTLLALKQDEHAIGLADLFSAWYDKHGDKPISAGQLLRGVVCTVDGEDDHPLYAAISQLIPHKRDEDITQKIGYLLNRHGDVIRGGLALRKVTRKPGSKAKVGNRYYIEKVGPTDASNDDFFGEETL